MLVFGDFDPRTFDDVRYACIVASSNAFDISTHTPVEVRLCWAIYIYLDDYNISIRANGVLPNAMLVNCNSKSY